MLISRPRRWALVGLAACAVAVSGVIVARLHTPALSSGVAAASTGSGSQLAADLTHSPWFALKVTRADVAFRDQGSPAGTPPPEVRAAAGILVDMDTGAILWQHNEHDQLPPASTIKMLSALVVFSNFNLDREITVTQSALLTAGDESKMGLKAGEKLTVRELLTGMLTVSANDAADVVAIDTVGMERFVGAMNAQAAALGLRDTHAVSPVGLSDPRTYSSAYDLAVLATIDENSFPLFADVVKTPYTALAPSASHPAFYLNNLNLLLSIYPAATGIKTGWTGDASACLIAMAVRGHHRLLSVILNGDFIYRTSRHLLDWGFTQEGLPSQLPTPSPSPTPPH